MTSRDAGASRVELPANRCSYYWTTYLRRLASVNKVSVR